MVARRKAKAEPTSSKSCDSAMGGASAYLVDANQRTFLFLETLLDRGNNYIKHLEQGTPPLLKFEHELVLDGKDLSPPCNYALLRLLPPKSMPVNADARPVIVVDPRAGHGPGIGGFKSDSEVGMAMHAGHPVYFVTFRPEPEENQTLFTVMQAEARFIEEVIKLHPQSKAKPVVIGNCQAGWAMMALNALRPELFGPLMIMGAPLSYWAGSSKLNPMRYAGASLGGSWLASLAGDMGADRFDGVQLVENFEKLNPSNTHWSKYYNLWSSVDTESERFLEFERWWGGFFRMTGSEIESIVENLFVGNKLARGTMQAGDRAIDLRQIAAPIVVFASWGDNITPPPQALDWIIDTWGDERAIAAAGRTIVYVLHESVGHLGIFVGGDIARKEHDQLVTSLDVIESLPPGLYEMKLNAKDETAERWEQLEPGQYTVHYEHRTMNDIRALNPEGRGEEAMFSTISKVSELNASIYKTLFRPWVKLLAKRPTADLQGRFHKMRMQRQLFSDTLPLAPFIRAQAKQARARRSPIPNEHPLRQVEKKMSEQIVKGLDQFRDRRNDMTVASARLMYGPLGLGAFFKPDESDADIAHARAQRELASFREAALEHIGEGGFAEAVCRIVLAGMVSIGAFERRSLRLARLLTHLPVGTVKGFTAEIHWVQLLKEQARIIAVAPVEALNALGQMLPDTASRERALAMSAAVMMIEPTLANPRSEIIEFLIDTLGVDPQRVIALARKLTDLLETAPASAPGPARKAKRTPRAA